MAWAGLLVGVVALLHSVQDADAVSNCPKTGGGYLTCQLDCCYNGDVPYCCASVTTIIGFVSIAIGIISGIVIIVCCCMSGRCCNKNNSSSVNPGMNQRQHDSHGDNWSKQRQSHGYHGNQDSFYGDPAYPPAYSSPSPRLGDPAYPPSFPGKNPTPRGSHGYGGYSAPY